MSKTIKSILPLLLGNWATLFLLLGGGLFSFLSAYHIRNDTVPLLLGCVGIACLCTVLWTIPYGGWGALFLLCAEALIAWRLRKILEPAWKLLWTAAVWNVERTYYPGGNGVLTMTLLLIILLLGIVLGWLTVRERCWHLPAVILIMPLLSAIMSGTLPALLPLLSQCTGWLTLLVTSLYNRKEVRSMGKGVWISLGGVSALLFLLWAALPQEGYTRPQWATNAKDHVVTAVTKYFSDFVWEGDGGSGSLDFGMGGSGSSGEVNGEIDLTNVGPRHTSENVVLQISGGQPGRVYLRGGASGIYTGDSWKPIEEANSFGGTSNYEELLYMLTQEIGGSDPAYFPALTVPDDMPRKQMTIQHIRETGSTAYFPYRLQGFPDGFATLSGDGNAVRALPEYQIAYIPGEVSAFQALEGAEADAEAFYRGYVYANYMEVPETAMQALLPLAEQVQKRTVSWPSTLPEPFQYAAATALRTAEVLSDTAVYDLNVTSIQPEEDFVQHFLEEKRGYCVHFATTGVLLLRMAGIPARYVEGYAAWIEEDGVSFVQGSQAHAWAEAYLDGYGWYPVEMTPGHQGGTPESLAPEILQTDVPKEPDELDVIEEDIPEEPDTPEGDDRPDEELETFAGENMEDTQNHPDQEKADFRGWWKSIVVLLAAAAAPYGAYRVAGMIRRRKRLCAESNQAVIGAYLRYQKLIQWGGPKEPVLEALAQKAKFSQHTMSQEERENAWGWVCHAESMVWERLNIWKRILFLAYFGGEA